MFRLFFLLLTINLCALSQNSYELAVLKYQGGGDWYANPTSLKNLAIFSLLRNIIKSIFKKKLNFFNYNYIS